MAREMELMRAGKDSQGDEFPVETLEKMVAEFKPGIPVTIGFDPQAMPVGVVVGLRMDGKVLMASVELDSDGGLAVSDGMELAAGGTFDMPPSGEARGPIIDLKLTGTALTKKKVK